MALTKARLLKHDFPVHGSNPGRRSFGHYYKVGCTRGGRTLRKDVFLPSKHFLSAFYKTLPFKNPSKNLLLY